MNETHVPLFLHQFLVRSEEHLEKNFTYILVVLSQVCLQNIE